MRDDLATPSTAVDAWLAAMWAQPPVLFGTPVEGAQIACRGWGLEATERPGLVLVHGLRAHGGWWDHIGPALAQDFRVLALTLSGMGDSDRRERYSRAQHGREVLAAARAAGFEQPILVAHSYGAVATLIAARADPDAVGRVVVLDSALPTPEDIGHVMQTPPLRTYPDQDAAISRFRLIPPGGWPHPAVLRHIAETSVKALPDGRWGWKFDNDMAQSLNEGDYRQSMIGNPVRCDLIYGELSEIFTEARRAGAPALIPNCGRYVVLPACHHHLMIEQPLALVAALRAILAR